METNKKIAVLIPCYNEDLTIKKVVQDFKKELPEADIVVYDNNSTDNTYKLALEAGAIVRKESRQGKGNVVRSMFKDIDADLYVMVDGDDTYPANAVHVLIDNAKGGIDMVVGDRLTNGTYIEENERSFHEFGNKLVRYLINNLFRVKLNDIMSGYRVFSKDFVKNYPVLCSGFQLETDMTIFALDKGFRICETPINFQERPAGSFSKLNTFSDGLKVILTIFNLYRYYKPFMFFSFLTLVFILLSLGTGLPVIIEFIDTHYITKVPSAVLASGLGILAMLLFITGIILDAVKRSNQEAFELRMKK
jgi:glycosyltransferase involved in cell wall biosynthesis